MELRHLTTDDKPAFDRLMAEAFGRGSRPQPAPVDELHPVDFTHSNRLGVFDGTRLVAAATVHDIALAWGERNARMGGVAGVACAADQRGRGHVNRILRQALGEMRDAGQYLSRLYPFAFAFYRAFGYEWVGEKRVTSIPLSLLPASPETRNVRMIEGLDARPDAAKAYGRAARRYRGMVARDQTRYPDFWKIALDHTDGRTTYVHVYYAPESGEPEGYLVWRYPATGDHAKVDEFVAATQRAYRGLLGVLHNYGTQLKTVEWNHAGDDPLKLTVMHWDIETKVKPVFMGRVVDVAAAFNALRVPANVTGAVMIGVRDATCEWNNRAYTLTAEGGRVHAAPTTREAEIVLDIQALSQAYWGCPSLAALRAADRIGVTDESAFALLGEMLTPAIVYLEDFF